MAELEHLFSDDALARAGIPRRVYENRRDVLRQGDLALTYVHQLLAPADGRLGPGRREMTGRRSPYLGEFKDTKVEHPGATLTLRIWPVWAMVLTQTCELEQADENDSRVAVAPIAFRHLWQGNHWNDVLRGHPGFVFLPGEDEAILKAFGAKGWPGGTDAAVSLASTTCVSRGMLRRASRFSITPQMRLHVQELLVRFWTLRGWSKSVDRRLLVDRKVVGVSETPELILDPCHLYRVHLDGGADDDGGDELSVGMIFRRK